MNPKTYNPVSITILKNSNEIGDYAAKRFIEVIKKIPDAVIILPTGSTPIPMYKKIVDLFESDRTIDLSKVKIFNLDEYIGLPLDHPLSYFYYMRKVLYDHLDRIDESRAPKHINRHIPILKHSMGPDRTAKLYEEKLEHAIKLSGRKKADLAILGIGGAYPIKDRSGRHVKIAGGHLGFNEPGSKVSDRARVVRLSQKTRLDTSFRFLNLRFCEKIYKKQFSYEIPLKAITLGIANILETDEILLLANMEEKAKIIQEAYENEPNPNIPATFLKYHNNVHWVLDKDAASELPHIKYPWCISKDKTNWNADLLKKSVIELLNVEKTGNLKDLNTKDFKKISISKDILDKFGGIKKIKEDSGNYLKYFIHSNNNQLLPKNSTVAIFSPHPDDDVIDMAVTIKKLAENDNKVWIIYMVNGENSVRNDYKVAEDKYKELLKQFKGNSKNGKIDFSENEELLRLARIETRKKESMDAAKILGIPESNLVFLDLPYYYHRGFVDLNPVDNEKDVMPVKELLGKIHPQHIFYSAESDPHGAHGLCAEIISRAVQENLSFWDVSFWGYRGAYEEWELYKTPDLIIIPFGEKDMDIKIKAIKSHSSQLNPLYPSFDNREFYERARDRNAATGRILEQLGYLDGREKAFAEVFRKISHAHFIRTK